MSCKNTTTVNARRFNASAEVPGSTPIPTAALAQIVDAQHQIHANRLDLAASMNLIVERIRKITGAQGAAVCLLEQEAPRIRRVVAALAATSRTVSWAEATCLLRRLLHDVLLRCADPAMISA